MPTKTKKSKTFTSQIEMIESFRKSFAETVKALEIDYSCAIKLGNITYDNQSFRSKMEVITQNEEGEIESKERIDYRTQCHFFGLEPEWLDASFRADNRDWKIVGLKPRARKRPVIAESANGKKYVFAAEDVVISMNNSGKN